jgi:hypothetical protein
MKSVRGAVRVGSSIWTATSGGVFVFDTVSEQYKKLTTPMDSLPTIYVALQWNPEIVFGLAEQMDLSTHIIYKQGYGQLLMQIGQTVIPK